jgi:hypothetical protein
MITVKMSPSDSQREIIEALDHHRTIVVNGGRRYGKTLLSQMALIKFALKKPRSRVLFASHAHSHNREVYTSIVSAPGMDQIIQHAALYPVPSITLINQSTIKFVSMEKMNKSRGGGYHLIVADECREIREEAYTRVLSAMASADRAPVLLLSTPKGADHWWYKLFLRGMQPNKDKIVSFLRPSSMSTCFQGAEGLEELEREKRLVGEDAFAVEYECQPISTGSHTFKDKHVKLCTGGSLTSASMEPTILGLDLGKQSDPAACCIMNKAGQVLYTKIFSLKKDWTELAEEVGNLTHAYNAKVAVDTFGTTRDSILDFFRPKCRNGLIPVPFNARQKQDIVGQIQLFLERGKAMIPEACSDLFVQLRTYEARSKGDYVSFCCPDGHDDLCVAFMLAAHGVAESWIGPILSTWSGDRKIRKFL